MLYLKNTEVAATYHVSLRTVLNWIESTKKGKLDLTLHTEGKKTYVANTSSNILRIERLVAEGKKYRNSRSLKVISPKPKFYELFTQAQIYDIVRNLEMHHEIPRQYNYFDGGAHKWDSYVEHLAEEAVPNLLNSTVDLLEENQTYIDNRLAKYKRVNVIDIGVGNAMPAKAFLERLLRRGVLGRYIAIDISDAMLDIASQNIHKWFGNKISFEGYQMDINFERFSSIITDDYLKKGVKDTVNVVLFLGGTPYNFRRPDDAFRTINESMNPNDLLIYSDKLETSDMHPEWFDYKLKPGKLAPVHRLVFDLLNIDESLYEAEMGFNPHSQQRYAQTRFTVGLTLKFEFQHGERIVELDKGDTILLWRSWQMDAAKVADQFYRNGFHLLHSSQTDDEEYILAVARVKCE